MEDFKNEEIAAHRAAVHEAASGLQDTTRLFAALRKGGALAICEFNIYTGGEHDYFLVENGWIRQADGAWAPIGSANPSWATNVSQLVSVDAEVVFAFTAQDGKGSPYLAVRTNVRTTESPRVARRAALHAMAFPEGSEP